MEDMAVSAKTLRRLRECSEQVGFQELGLSNTGVERKMFLKQCFDKIKEVMLYRKDLSSLRKEMGELFEGYSKEWFGLKKTYEQAKQNDYALVMRLGKYLLDMEVEKCIADAPYAVDMLSALQYHGKTFRRIVGKADLVLFHKNGTIEAINFEMGMPRYSYTARSDANKPAYSMELLALKMGLEQRYPGVKVSLYYLKNKDDTKGMLQIYESKRGKNIISHDFDKMNPMQLLYKAATLHVEKKCDMCIYRGVCRISEIRTQECETHDVAETEIITEASKKETYTTAQKEVIYHINGPLNCIAVPGAGKTFSLVKRMNYLMEEGVKPNNILFVTFTRKAAEEIKDRVRSTLGLSSDEGLPNIYTFNGLGYQILKDNPGLLGRRVKLAGRLDKLRIIRDVLDYAPVIKGVSYDGIYLQYGLIRNLERCFEKIEVEGEDAFRASYKGVDADGVLAAYSIYLKEFEKREFVTYDMQITLCNELFEKNPALSLLYAKVFKYIMVDEFQDVSKQNVEMIYHIAKHHNNIVVVGDDDQSIYGFRGGSNYYMLHFGEEFQDAKTVIMADNFRSDSNILQVADELIGKNEERFEKEFVSHSENGMRPALIKEFDISELPELIRKIHTMGYSYGDIAVLARYNKTLERAYEVISPLMPCAEAKDYVVQDSIFLAIKDVLFLAVSGMADEPLYRLLSWLGVNYKKEIKPGRSFLEELCENGLQLPVSVTTDEIVDESNESVLQQAIRKIHNVLLQVQKSSSMERLLRNITNGLFGIEKHPVIDILTSMCDERAITGMRELYSLMNDMVLFSDETRVGYGSKDEVRLLTAHDSKGMEFPVVIVLSVEEFDDTPEERRLLYVAFTRAKKGLFITESMYSVAKLLPDFKAQVAMGR